MFTWLPLSASAEASHPSRTMSTNVSSPAYLMVGPVSTVEATSGKEATFVVSLRLVFLGQASCFSGPPLVSLNLFAKCRRLHDVDNPLRSVQNPRTRNICILVSGNNSWPASSGGTVPLCSPFRWGVFYWARIWWKQVWFNSSCASYWSRIPLVTLMRIVG